MSLLERFDVGDQIPELYINFYGRIAWRFESLQSCLDNLRRGVESGFSSGNIEMSFFCVIHVIKCTFYTGENLRSVLKEIDHYLKLLAETHTSKLNENFLLYFRETVSVLIDKGHATGLDKPSSSILSHGSYLGGAALLVQQSIRAYWSGYTERCDHFIQKCLPLVGQEGQFNSYLIKFYHGK